MDKIRNEEILKGLDQELLSVRIAERQLKYTGHVYRMPENRSARLALTASFPQQQQQHGEFINKSRVSWRRQVLSQLQGMTDEDVEELFAKKEQT